MSERLLGPRSACDENKYADTTPRRVRRTAWEARESARAGALLRRGLLLAALREAVPGQGGRDAQESAFQARTRRGWKVRGSTEPHQRDPPPQGPSQAIPSPSRRPPSASPTSSSPPRRDAMVARSLDPFYRDSIPSAACGARQGFPGGTPGVGTRERHLGLFGEAQVECTGHGAVIAAPGSVTARRGTSARRASTPTAQVPGTVAAILSRGGASAGITIRQISSRGANFALYLASPRARTPPWTSAWTPRDDAWFLCNSAACSASTSEKAFAEHCPRRTPSRGRRATRTSPRTLPNPRRRRRRIHRHARPDRPSRLFGLFGIRRVQRVADSSVPGGTVPIRARSAKRGVRGGPRG